MHPSLATAFRAMDDAGIAWCLLRGEASVADPTGDIDLLVAAPDLPRLDVVLAEVGYVAVHAWGAGDHRGYLGWDATTDRFLELDVESSVIFGPSGHFLTNWLRPALRTDTAPALLAGRRRSGPLVLLAPDDGFWALLLHCVVDKRAVAPRHAERLLSLAAEARPDGALGTVVDAHCPPGWDAARILAAARDGRWADLVEMGVGLTGRATPADRSAALGRGLRRVARGVRERRRGLTVAIMGPDGAGKSTLAAALTAAFGPRSRLVYMGLWQGEDGERSLPTAALAAARRPFRSWRRTVVASYHQVMGRLVVFDRHPRDALLPPSPPHVRLKRLFFTFLARSVPAPSLTLVLDVPADVAARRRPEEDPDALAAARDGYLALAREQPRAVVLDADRDPDELRKAAIDEIWRAMRAGRARRR